MLKLQTCTCSTIYVDACMYCNGFVHLNAFLNILRDPIWFDKCSGRDTFERQFLKAFFQFFLILPTLPTFKLGQGFALFIMEGVSVRHAEALC